MPRYIDADALMKKLNEYPIGQTIVQRYNIDGFIEAFPTADVVEKERYDRLLENANILADAVRKYQTTDVPERNVGKWIENTEYFPTTYTCPFCSYKIYRETTDFCPNCGADMREETDHAQLD